MMKKMNYKLGIRLGKKKSGILKLLNFKDRLADKDWDMTQLLIMERKPPLFPKASLSIRVSLRNKNMMGIRN